MYPNSYLTIIRAFASRLCPLEIEAGGDPDPPYVDTLAALEYDLAYRTGRLDLLNSPPAWLLRLRHRFLILFALKRHAVVTLDVFNTLQKALLCCEELSPY
ncbi:hypothetical protein JCM8547_000565 [Rhodosporidiobolus lusitaniae]